MARPPSTNPSKLLLKNEPVAKSPGRQRWVGNIKRNLKELGALLKKQITAQDRAKWRAWNKILESDAATRASFSNEDTIR